MSSKITQDPKSKTQTLTIHPVILAVPAKVADYKPRDRVTFLSRHAREALIISAKKSGLRLEKTTKGENGAPLPVDGVYWSISHKTQYVAGVAASSEIGIDLEKIQSCSQGVFSKTADESEWSLAQKEEDILTTFFRFWTSKEAVVKACGTGIRDLKKCRVIHIPDAEHLEIYYEERYWRIQHFYFDGHVASIVQNDFIVDWTVEK